jgi:hypothetical protein
MAATRRRARELTGVKRTCPSELHKSASDVLERGSGVRAKAGFISPWCNRQSSKSGRRLISQIAARALARIALCRVDISGS